MTPIGLIRKRFSKSSTTSPESAIVRPSQELKQRSDADIIDKELKHISNADKQKVTLLKKLKICKELSDFKSNSAEAAKKRELKRKTLLELVEFFNSVNQSKGSAGAISFSEEMLTEIVKMISANLFVEVSPAAEEFDPDEDEPILDPSWSHKQVIFEITLRIIISPELSTKVAKKPGMFDHSFFSNLIYLFETEDSRERDYLKSLLHRLYGKFFTHRKFIREHIACVFMYVIDNDRKHNGLAELLEILGSIINGFSLPLKKEHLMFFESSLLPLHRSRHLHHYQQQLIYCVLQFVEKDNFTSLTVFAELIKYWPVTSSQKQVIFISEIEEILEAIHPISDKLLEKFLPILQQLYRIFANCIKSPHFQISERVLYLWNNQTLSTAGCLSHTFADKALPIIYPSLLKNIEENSSHWNERVIALSKNVISLYKEALGDAAFQATVDKMKLRGIAEAEKERAERWSRILGKKKECESANPVLK